MASNFVRCSPFRKCIFRIPKKPSCHLFYFPLTIIVPNFRILALYFTQIKDVVPFSAFVLRQFTVLKPSSNLNLHTNSDSIFQFTQISNA